MPSTKESDWIRHARFTSWWLEFEDLAWPDPNLTKKWRQRAHTFQELGVNAVVMFGFHFRWDYIPVMERVLGALREVAEICHEHHLKVVEHHSAMLIHRVRSEQDRRDIRTRYRHYVPFYPDGWENVVYRGKKPADWRQVSARDGAPVYFELATCECFCPNHPDYQEAYLNYIGRHVESVPVDALLSADLHYLPDVYSCACEHCQARLEKEEGFRLPPSSDRSFRENYQSSKFLAWLQARYRWTAEHHQRLRTGLPRHVMLCGCASTCTDARLTQIGLSPQHLIASFDAIFHEIFHQNQPASHPVEIASELAGFTSLARHHKKPLVALCYANGSEEVGPWLHLLSRHHARPWISKQVHRQDAPPEEVLLANGYSYPRGKKQDGPAALQAIMFSESHRDRLGPAGAEAYVETYRELCMEILARGDETHVLFDSLWDGASPEEWECLWIPDAEALSPEKEKVLRDWQEKGLALGFP